MNQLQPLIGRLAKDIPDSWLADPRLYADRLIRLMEKMTHPQPHWVVWNPAAAAVSKPLLDWLEQQIKEMPDLNHTRVIGLDCADVHTGNCQKSSSYSMPEKEDSTGQLHPFSSPTSLPLVWRRDYLLQELSRAFEPLPSALYLPYEIMPLNPHQITFIPIPPIRRLYGLRWHKRLDPYSYPIYPGIRWRIFPSRPQLEGVVPVIANSRARAYRQAGALRLEGSSVAASRPGNSSALSRHGRCEGEPSAGAEDIPPAAPSQPRDISALTRNGDREAERDSKAQQVSGMEVRSPASPSGTSPAVSLLLPVYNMQASLGWAVRSVLAQTSPDFELLIGDDGSEDGTADLPYLRSDPRIRIHRFSPNRGKVFVLNELLGLARGRYVLELDGDDWLQPEAVALLTAAMEGAPEAAIATGASGLWQGTRHLGPLWRGALPYRGHRADASAAAPLVPRFYRAAMLRGIGGWPIRAGADARLFEDIAVCEALLAEHPHPAVIHRPVYHRVLRPDSVSQRGGARYPAWFMAQADNLKGGHPQ
ncbi:Hyaluronan synthase [compost metagenome]